MFKRVLITVGIVAVLLTGYLPAEDGCGLEAAVDHACCAQMQPEPVSSCCAGTEADLSSETERDSLACSCVHPPSATFAVAASSLVGQDGGSMVDVVENTAPHLDSDPELHRLVNRRVRSHPPPPVFLLDCSFLI